MTPKALVLSAEAPSRRRGASVYLHELARRNADLVDLLVPHSPDEAEFDRAVPYRVHRARTGTDPDHAAGGPATTWALLKRGRHLAAAHRYGLVLGTDTSVAGSAAMMLGASVGLPWGVFLHQDPTASPRYAGRFLSRVLIFRAPVLVASSNHARRRAGEVGRRVSAIPVVHPGADHLRFKPGDPPEAIVRRYGLGGRTVVLSVGQLVPAKGHATMIRALPRIVRAVPEVLYLVVGQGPARGVLQELARREGVSDYVVFAGLVHHDDLPGLYRAASLYVTCTQPGAVGTEEGFGVALAEAAASGLPAVGPDTGAEADIIDHGHTGFHVDTTKAPELARTLTDLLGAPDRLHTLGAAAAEHARRHFDWSKSAERLGRLIRRHLAN